MGDIKGKIALFVRIKFFLFYRILHKSVFPRNKSNVNLNTKKGMNLCKNTIMLKIK